MSEPGATRNANILCCEIVGCFQFVVLCHCLCVLIYRATFPIALMRSRLHVFHELSNELTCIIISSVTRCPLCSIVVCVQQLRRVVGICCYMSEHVCPLSFNYLCAYAIRNNWHLCFVCGLRINSMQFDSGIIRHLYVIMTLISFSSFVAWYMRLIIVGVCSFLSNTIWNMCLWQCIS